eukprot:6522191-Pyramimonas_sp.AAC.1
MYAPSPGLAESKAHWRKPALSPGAGARRRGLCAILQSAEGSEPARAGSNDAWRRLGWAPVARCHGLCAPPEWNMISNYLSATLPRSWSP